MSSRPSQSSSISCRVDNGDKAAVADAGAFALRTDSERCVSASQSGEFAACRPGRIDRGFPMSFRSAFDELLSQRETPASPWRPSTHFRNAGPRGPSAPIARRRTISRPNRRCSARSSSTTTPSTASPISCEAEHFVEEIHRRIFEIAGSADSRRQARDADHAEDLSRRARSRRRHRAAISGAARRRSDDHHQRLRLRPHHLRSRDAPRTDLDRRGRRQRRL